MRICAVDIGGTIIKSGIIENGTLSTKIKTPANSHLGGPYLIESAKKIIAGYTNYDCIGISTAGQVDSDQGIIRYANQNILDYTGMKIQDILQETFNVPVAVENDVNAIAVGEAVYGAGKKVKDKNFICLAYGTGIGGAIVINGQIYKGAAFSAGEFGSIITHGNKEGHGYYEKYASVRTLIENVKSILPDISNGRQIFSNFGNPAVKEIVDNWIDEVLYGLASLVHVFNPSLVILGGGIMEDDHVLKMLNERIGRHIMPSFAADLVLSKATLGNDAGLWGVGYLAGIKYIEKNKNHDSL